MNGLLKFSEVWAMDMYENNEKNKGGKKEKLNFFEVKIKRSKKKREEV